MTNIVKELLGRVVDFGVVQEEKKEAKRNKRKVEDKESKFQYCPAMKKRKGGRDRQKNTTNNKTAKKIKAVMFVPHTRHSELALRLRQSDLVSNT